MHQYPAHNTTGVECVLPSIRSVLNVDVGGGAARFYPLKYSTTLDPTLNNRLEEIMAERLNEPQLSTASGLQSYQKSRCFLSSLQLPSEDRGWNNAESESMCAPPLPKFDMSSLLSTFGRSHTASGSSLLAPRSTVQMQDINSRTTSEKETERNTLQRCNGSPLSVVKQSLSSPGVGADLYAESNLESMPFRRKAAVVENSGVEPRRAGAMETAIRFNENDIVSQITSFGSPVACQHGADRASCKECEVARCCHGRRTNYCKECKASIICIHDVRKIECKECKGSKYCAHNRVKYLCKECKGSQICIHDKVKTRCRECGGKAICEHSRVKYRCKDCQGRSICPHGKVRTRCKDCKGSDFCVHDRKKSCCKECGGTAICVHDKVKFYCRECKGAAICEHSKVKYRCRECCGSEICIHKNVKYRCRECRGSEICIHSKLKYSCRQCKKAQLEGETSEVDLTAAGLMPPQRDEATSPSPAPATASLPTAAVSSPPTSAAVSAPKPRRSRPDSDLAVPTKKQRAAPALQGREDGQGRSQHATAAGSSQRGRRGRSAGAGVNMTAAGQGGGRLGGGGVGGGLELLAALACSGPA